MFAVWLGEGLNICEHSSNDLVEITNILPNILHYKVAPELVSVTEKLYVRSLSLTQCFFDFFTQNKCIVTIFCRNDTRTIICSFNGVNGLYE